MKSTTEQLAMNGRTIRPVATIALASDHEYFVIDRLVDAYTSCGFEAEFVGWDRLGRQPRADSPENVRRRYIMRGWGYANWSLLFALPLWCLRLFFHLLFRATDLVHALDFDCALPAVLAGLLRKNKVIYDIQDNFEERHHFPAPIKAVLRSLNLWVARHSAAILVTDENRIIGGLERYRARILIVANCPPDLRTGHERIQQPSSLTVSAFGYNLTSNRGIGLLVAASARVPGVTVLTAGRIVEPWLEEMIRSAPHVQHLGMLPQSEVLHRTCDVDAVFAFYDPSIEINRRASSAKWYDAMMAGRPVLSNREILNAPWIEQEGFGFTCAYSEQSLADLLAWLRDHPEELADKGARARRLFETRFNRSAMNQVICTAARHAIHVGARDLEQTVEAG